MTGKRQPLETRIRSAFGLKSLPFRKDIDPDRIFRADLHVQAFDRMRYLLDRRGIGAIYGAPGTGKSTIMRSFLSSLGRANHAVCYVNHTSCAVVDLHRQIAQGFDLRPRYRRGDLMQMIKERLLRLSRTKKVHPVLVIDEAHLLPCTFLDEIRILTSFDEDSRDDMTLILAGHPQLESNLRLAVNEALAQRIVVRIRLRSLHPEEVEEYIAFRMELAGRTARLFQPDAVEAIAKASRGVPRLIDRVAEHCLLIAVRDLRKEVDSDIVMEAVEEVEP